MRSVATGNPRASHSRRGQPKRSSHVSIIRVGLAETKKFAQGYDAIFGKPTKQTKTPSAGKKKVAKKKSKKK
jgi:hypothetical protein